MYELPTTNMSLGASNIEVKLFAKNILTNETQNVGSIDIQIELK